MSFLDNSGDIILDAVLTDTGRFRLAKGDGSFKIVKFALGDDEINYASYDKNNASGSAYYDLEILQTPVLEAFTNNTSTMKSKLISIPRTNLLYLPIMKLSGDSNSYTSGSSNVPATGSSSFLNFTRGTYVVAVDQATVGDNSAVGLIVDAQKTAVTQQQNEGILNGFTPYQNSSRYIRVDQGLDTTEISREFQIDADLRETQYIIEIDNRLGSIVSVGSSAGRLGIGTEQQPASVSFIDDDNIASYYLSANDTNFVQPQIINDASSQVAGPLGSGIAFKIQASTDLSTSTYLFEQLGSTGLTVKAADRTSNMSLRYIDTTVKVTGATTGYRIDIPVRFVKKV
jgi:hypothetical protein